MQTAAKSVNSMLGFILRLIYPPKCIFCGRLLPPGSEYEACGNCMGEIRTIPSAYREFGDIPYVDGVLCACVYGGNVKKAITKFKYYNRPSYHRFFARLICRNLREIEEAPSFDMVLSVPLHSSRMRSRGYNQSQLLSRYIGRELGIPDKSRILKRTRDTGFQSHLSREKRQANVEGAFSVKKSIRLDGKTILLVDDIFTTGSTINQCARVLKEAGAARVFAAVLASTKKL